MDTLLTLLIVVAVIAFVVSQRNKNMYSDDEYEEYEEYEYEEPPYHDQTQRNSDYSQPYQPNNVTVNYVEQKPKPAKVTRGGLYCKKCRSTDIHMISDNSKNVKASGLLMGCLFWPLMLLGFNGKKASQQTYRCQNCGNVFRYKVKRKYR